MKKLCKNSILNNKEAQKLSLKIGNVLVNLASDFTNNMKDSSFGDFCIENPSVLFLGDLKEDTKKGYLLDVSMFFCFSSPEIEMLIDPYPNPNLNDSLLSSTDIEIESIMHPYFNYQLLGVFVKFDVCYDNIELIRNNALLAESITKLFSEKLADYEPIFIERINCLKNC